MRIVKFDEFIELPEGTVYGFYRPCFTNDLYIKGESLNSKQDWFYSCITPCNFDYNNDCQNIDAMQAMENGEHCVLDVSIQERDGMFDYDRMFLIYEEEDILKIINKLKSCIDGTI